MVDRMLSGLKLHCNSITKRRRRTAAHVRRRRYTMHLTTEIVPRPAVPDGLYGPTGQHRLVDSAVADW